MITKRLREFTTLFNEWAYNTSVPIVGDDLTIEEVLDEFDRHNFELIEKIIEHHHPNNNIRVSVINGNYFLTFVCSEEYVAFKLKWQ